MTEIVTDLAARPGLGHDAKLVGLVGTAHGLSHFYQLVLPPIFPLLTAAFGVAYAELGLAVSAGYVVAGLMQTPAGILIDRIGPARMLTGGLALYGAATLLVGLAPGFWWLVPLLIVAGLGDCVFHPADYAIMNTRIDAARLGRAYGVHSLSGNIGWVAAPFSVLGLTALFGWRAALVILGGVGLLFALYLLTQRAALGAPPGGGQPVMQPARPPAAAGVLLSPPILMCFLYFALLAAALTGLQTFMPSAVPAAFGVGIATANLMLTAFLLGSSLGVLAGGVVADRWQFHRTVIALGLAAGAGFGLVFAWAALPVSALVACAALAGLALGATSPARDMLVRAATPPGASGKVFGFVYSGLDLGAVVATPLLGLLIDRGQPRLVFVVGSAALVAAIATALLLGNRRKAA